MSDPTSRDSHALLPEQQAVIDGLLSLLPGENALVECPAGGAKTFLLVAFTKRASARSARAIAFNKRNAVDLAARMPGWVDCSTFNAAGHAAWGKKTGLRLNVNTRKVGDLVAAEIKARQLPGDAWHGMKALVTRWRQDGAVPADMESPWRTYSIDDAALEDAIAESEVEMDLEQGKAALDVLRKSIHAAHRGQIDFDDQIYMSCCFGGTFLKYSLLLVDEVQDLSPLNIEMVARQLAPNGNLIAVGDRFQGIYAFRGADAMAVDTMIQRFSLKSFTADTSFRCPKRIVELARLHHPRIVAFEANGLGEVLTPDTTLDPSTIAPGSAVLCRNNAPLAKLGLAFLLQGKGVNYLGGQDLARGLKSIIKDLGPSSATRGEALEALALWESNETVKAAASRPHLVAKIKDKAAVIRAALQVSDTLAQAGERLAALFLPEAGPVTLSTGHKSKGFEWDTVYFLEPALVPSPYAAKAGGQQLAQELNLRYVIQTRAKVCLIHCTLATFNIEPT